MKLPYSTLTSASLLAGRAATDNNQCFGSSTGQPLSEGTYAEPLRPQIHYTPSENFMNDPNGLIYANNVYHLYHQWNSKENVPGYQNWGHATSEDLLHWDLHPAAITPDNDDGPFIFSGSAVIDENNTSGLFDESTSPTNRLVAIYTEASSEKIQSQHVAYSTDGGYTYTKRPEPVIDINNPEFRDPKVFWYEQDSKWIMIVSLASQHQMIIYESKNLIDWNETSRFGNVGQLGYQYECPDLFPLKIEGSDEEKWVLITSVNPGAIRGGGSGTSYFIGDFDGKTFTPIDTAVREMDFGYDDYAGVTFNNVPDGRRLWIGWASNWLYTGNVPTEPWRSSLTLVHELSLTQVDLTDQHQALALRHKPVDLSSLITETVKETNSPMSSDSIDFPTKGAVDLSIDVSFSSETEASKSSKSASRITIESEDGVNSIEFGVQFSDHIVYVNRANSGWSAPTFGSLGATSITIPDDNKVNLRAVIDHSQIELFVQDGIHFASMVFYFQDGRVPARLRYENEEGVTIDHLKLDALKSIWEC
ncbi:hypothetical protein WALSEDRAFT_22750 [Wallemia mellicola CBS 633.66]|nr:hypothetical protein WALSEDRAFT_22750 [Wallemia mellicola CBS 633.66]TIB69719.1 hypothetical protein E3Q23_04269 [Wallemia mellicola]EIM19298.1 hypothetical protein WALSEDRAFT_22750 [Wallemia mellicola CBS 633.66]TIB85081.1 hypothetical protein E3Q19_04305 [Wallemia mellicola]TIB99145.1 hypothetical protein E3Q16_04221 [Wallemia mellicola]TIC11875.1 hypothetical protein E3Q13_04303 [Wallemia mellicola]|eukprot:XP_006960690.1 hypothetical protein WALSEDRAFT_22750 [Wallemia mellicola CBS 633.66]